MPAFLQYSYVGSLRNMLRISFASYSAQSTSSQRRVALLRGVRSCCSELTAHAAHIQRSISVQKLWPLCHGSLRGPSSYSVTNYLINFTYFYIVWNTNVIFTNHLDSSKQFVIIFTGKINVFEYAYSIRVLVLTTLSTLLFTLFIKNDKHS